MLIGVPSISISKAGIYNIRLNNDMQKSKQYQSKRSMLKSKLSAGEETIYGARFCSRQLCLQFPRLQTNTMVIVYKKELLTV